jgi:hypothetical protein
MLVEIKSQEVISAPYTAYTGHVMGDVEVRQYNAYLRDINKFAGKVLDTGSMAYIEREIWLDRRHRFFVSVCEPGDSN